MLQSLICPQGHGFQIGVAEAASAEIVCPVCGATVSSRAFEQTVNPLKGDASQPSAQVGESAGSLQGRPAAESRLPDAAGRFTILWEHARGGLGQVSLAQDHAIGRQVALKQIRSDRLDSPQARERFLTEAAITGQLEHPGIVPIYALELDADGQPYYVMRFVQGRTLAEAIAEHHRQPSPAAFSELLRRFESVCQTIAYAHSQKVIHRDLKPANIMLGSYGETLVLDWGLAKRLGAPDQRAELAMEPGIASATAPMSLSTIGSEETMLAAGPSSGALTVHGQVLGTPAYMPPEQARGELNSLDERCDVFALGAILCTLLTGAPPYVPRSGGNVLMQAAAADLADAMERLAQCGADAKLVQIANECLAPLPNDRPRDAGILAGLVTGYLASVQERLKAAEIETAAAQAKAAEERRRRRATAALAISIMILMLGGGAAGAWYSQYQRDIAFQRVQVERDVASTLGEASGMLERISTQLADQRKHYDLLDQPTQWQADLESANAAIQHGEALLRSAPPGTYGGVADQLQEMSRRWKSAEEARQLIQQLDDLRAEMIHDFDYASVLDEFTVVFREAGFELGQEEAAVTASRLRESPLRWPLVTFLDYWADCANKAQAKASGNEAAELTKLVEQISRVVREADADPWRDRFRDVSLWRDRAALERLAADAQAVEQSGPVIALLLLRLYYAGGNGAALNHAALLRHPRDFWLLAVAYHHAKDPAERLTCLRAMLVARPDAASIHGNIANMLASQGQAEQAMAYCLNARRLRPNSPRCYGFLSYVLNCQRRWDESIVECHKGLALNPTRNIRVYLNTCLAQALAGKGRLDEAVAPLREATAAAPGNRWAHFGLATVLRRQGKWDDALEAIRHCTKPVSDSAGVKLHETLRVVLEQKWQSFVQGQFSPQNDVERQILASLSLSRRHFRAAAESYAVVFANAPELVGDLEAAHRYRAACAAVQAGLGQGDDVAKLDDAKRLGFLRQARGWLQADLDICAKLLLSGKAEDRKLVQLTLGLWQRDPQLAGIRGEAAIAKLPQEERTAWNQLWAKAAGALRQADAVPAK